MKVINQSIGDASFNKSEFDLTCYYSVLHHLPDYANAIKTLATFLKKGRVMYIDHEASPFDWDDASKVTRKVKRFFILSNRLINKH